MAMSSPTTLYRLVDRDLLARLMQRTSAGDALSGRQLAADIRVPHQTIAFLLNGDRSTVAMETAHAICNRLGVGVLVLFAPPAHAETHPALSAVSA